MNTTQIWTNIIAYAVQIGVLVAIGATLPSLVRLKGGGKASGTRLLYWQLLLVACIALPWVRPWHATEITVSNMALPSFPYVPHYPVHEPVQSPAWFDRIGATDLALLLLAAGCAVRLIRLAFGMRKLAGYRKQGRPVPLPAEWVGVAGHASLLESDDIGSPVTFGFFRPVVLLPAGFSAMPDAMRDAILFHELKHVERRDWLFTAGEELLRAVFWFHPAIWWVLGEIQLAREQTVDQAVIEMTQQRDPYLDTLLAMAGLAAEVPQMDLAPAPLFLRRRHLRQRVMGIVQEARMSKTRLVLAQVVAVSAMAVTCWYVAGAIPLEAQPQMVTVADDEGVTVNVNGLQLMHRSRVAYPADARAKGVEGTVVVQLRLDANGEVTDSAILSGPDELRKGVQQAVANWHFDKSVASSVRVVNIDFRRPVVVVETSLPTSLPTAQTAPRPVAAVRAQIVDGDPTGTAGVVNVPRAAQVEMQMKALQQITDEYQKAMAERAQGGGTSPEAQQALTRAEAARIKALSELRLLQAQQAAPRKVSSISVVGLSDSARDQLLARLPVRVGDDWPGDSVVQTAVRAFDPHLVMAFGSSMSDGNPSGIAVTIRTQEPATTSGNGGALPTGAVRVSSGVAAASILNAVKPVYPPLAKMARQQGTVKLEATIGKDGTVQNLTVISGPPLLIPSSLEAVKQWTYKPMILNGTAQDVVTTVDVNFSLAE